MYWGFVAATALVGITFLQGYMYYNRNHDHKALQIAVAIMLIVDFSSTAVIATTIFHYFLINYGNLATFNSIPAEWVLENALTALVTCIAQLFFASRIRLGLLVLLEYIA
ncbi:hypothetical protein HYDPIDRAFT_113741 [Hydnomerulius pinastri MD-312]|uniref:Uncharacterized protein n=1 Tax=Hydnomerulius pinastri MD-312 TaxID=994086 RepID=A0A0C9VC07_9AGAM|nr:hypothetical protein HYDPIDRAFT_113741 [Hydnomerulius pinastri MD-312]